MILVVGIAVALVVVAVGVLLYAGGRKRMRAAAVRTQISEKQEHRGAGIN